MRLRLVLVHRKKSENILENEEGVYA